MAICASYNIFGYEYIIQNPVWKLYNDTNLSICYYYIFSHCKNVMVISTLSGLSQLHLFRCFYSTPHHTVLLGCFCSEVCIVALIMQLVISWLKWPLHFLSWLSQLHLFRGFHCTPHHVASAFMTLTLLSLLSQLYLPKL